MTDPVDRSTPATRLAELLRGRQRDLIGPDGDGGALVRQLGSTVLPEPFPVPAPTWDDPVAPRGGDAVIETFVAKVDGSAAGTGGDAEVIAWWGPQVEAMVRRVVTELASHGVELADPIYVTASATTLDRVTSLAHFDDDQFHPDAGPGLVAIASSHRGPRVARGALPAPTPRAGAPLGLDEATLSAAFELDGGPSASIVVQATDADRLVLFPRFGQLHAGPTTAADGLPADQIRNLLVLRADTVPR